MVTLKKYKMKLLLLLGVLTLINSCVEDLINDDKLSIQRTAYMGNQLKIDGYYYNEYANGSYWKALFFYENGVILSGGGFPINELENQEEDFKSAEWISIKKEHKYNWGVFNIEGNSIKFERWYPSDPPLKAYVREGEILNDTTFIIKESYRIVEGQKTEEKERNEIYEFKSFSPKPDSTNKFIEY